MKIERMPMNNVKERKKNERSTEMKQMTGTGSTRHLKRSTGSMDPTQTSAYHGWKRYLPWPAPTRECQKQTHLQQWWKCSEDPVFPAFKCFGGQNS